MKTAVENSIQFSKSFFRKGFLFFTTIFFSFILYAQTFPVQITPQLIPPFSGYIPDYASPENENFRVIILFTDFSRPTYDVKLKIKIQGQGITLQSPAWFYSGAVTLEPGIPKMLSGTDLSDLLNENNLEFSGITRAQYDVRKVLPEGFYTVTVTAYDFINPLPIQVSNEGTTQAWMVLNDPPYLNLPSCNANVVPQTPQQIVFSWTAMNLATPSSALGSEYIFELWEIFPANQSPGNIVASTAPLYSFTTSLTFVNYGITEPPLTVGRQYVWRVRAHDLENRELFRNNGYSELCTLSYGTTLDLLGNNAIITLQAQALTNRQARCWWGSLSVYANYRVEFRKVSSANWFPLTTNRASLRIPDLESNTNYEAQVTGILSNGDEGPVSNLVNWHTPEKPVFNCGEAAPPPAQQNFHPLTQANEGMIWEIGQFEMVVTSLNGNSNSAGWYSGLGKVAMPLGWTVACSFSGIQVGEDHVVYSGEVKAIADGITEWVSQWENHFNQYESESIDFNGNADSIYINENGDIIIIDNNGNITSVGNPSNGQNNIIITDDNGDCWIILPNGGVVFVSQAVSEILHQAVIHIKQNAVTNKDGTFEQALESYNDANAKMNLLPSNYNDQDVNFAILEIDTVHLTNPPAATTQFVSSVKSWSDNSVAAFALQTEFEISTQELENNTWSEWAIVPNGNGTLNSEISSRLSQGQSQQQVSTFAQNQIDTYVRNLTSLFMNRK